MNTDITNKSGTISLYGFMCGYVEEYDGPQFGVRLWQDGCWHVRRHHNASHEDGLCGYIRKSWECFDTLTEARKFYNKEVKAIK